MKPATDSTANPATSSITCLGLRIGGASTLIGSFNCLWLSVELGITLVMGNVIGKPIVVDWLSLIYRSVKR